MTLTLTLPVEADRDPQTLINAQTFDKLALHFAGFLETTPRC